MLGPSSSSTQTPSAVLAGLRVPAKDLSSAAGGAWCPARNMKHLASIRPLLGKSGDFWKYDLEDQYIDGLWAIHQEMRRRGVWAWLRLTSAFVASGDLDTLQAAPTALAYQFSVFKM